jgi:hypothetical protein
MDLDSVDEAQTRNSGNELAASPSAILRSESFVPIAGIPIQDSSSNVVLGHIVSTQLPTATACWHCGSADRPEMLYVPCHCNTIIHRDCFRQWRTGWINPRNYFQCPNCMRDYNIERIKPSTAESEQRIWRRFRLEVAKMWFLTFFIVGVIIAAVALIAYYSDRSSKNVPVGVKYMLSSVVNGFPDGNSTDVWRAEFKRPDVYVWQYYTLLGCLATSILILVVFALLGCTFDEKERERKGACNCCADCCRGSSNDSMMWCIYCNNVSCPNPGDCSSSDCNSSCDTGGCDNEAAIIFVFVVIIIVAIAVLLSAIFVVILYACQKWALLYDRFASMLKAQAAELEGETIVLGLNEHWRPVTQV